MRLDDTTMSINSIAVGMIFLSLSVWRVSLAVHPARNHAHVWINRGKRVVLYVYLFFREFE